MTQRTINVTDVRDNFSEVLGRVKFGKEIVTIEKKGKPYAVIISPAQYEAYQRAAREQFAAVVHKIRSRHRNVLEGELARDIAEEVEAARTELYARGE